MTMAITLAVALLLGYLVTVVCSLTLTFGLTSAAPGFVASNGRIAPRYVLVRGAVWLLCAAAGGYAAALLSGNLHPVLVGIALTAALAAVLWSNVERRKDQALAGQLAMTLLSATGVAAGMWLRLRS